MNDAELTSLAAKAFGNAPDNFSPLTNDGDALRLAVKLGMHIEFPNDNLIEVCNCFERRNGDPYAATRRAIVRGAVTDYMCWVD